jgi:hypothetical protein
MQKSPVFIVGSPRSGTSILVDVLLSAGYHGFREGSFLPLIHRIGAAVDWQFSIFSSENKAILISNVDKESIKARLFETLGDTVSKLHPATPWFDKTGNPEMILSIPVLRVLWPECVFVFAMRRGIENIVSRMRKFSNHGFEYHCVDWAKNMAAWRSVRGALQPADYVEIDQQDLLRSPEEVACKLGMLLHLGPDAEQRMVETLRSNRPQETESGSAGRLLALQSCGWSETQIGVFLERCKHEMEAYGYTLDESYRVMAGAGQAQ